MKVHTYDAKPPVSTRQKTKASKTPKTFRQRIGLDEHVTPKMFLRAILSECKLDVSLLFLFIVAITYCVSGLSYYAYAGVSNYVNSTTVVHTEPNVLSDTTGMVGNVMPIVSPPVLVAQTQPVHMQPVQQQRVNTVVISRDEYDALVRSADTLNIVTSRAEQLLQRIEVYEEALSEEKIASDLYQQQTARIKLENKQLMDKVKALERSNNKLRAELQIERQVSSDMLDDIFGQPESS